MLLTGLLAASLSVGAQASPRSLKFYFIDYSFKQDGQGLWVGEDGYTVVQRLDRKPYAGKSSIYKYKMPPEEFQKLKGMLESLKPDQMTVVKGEVKPDLPVFYFGFSGTNGPVVQFRIEANNWDAQPADILKLRSLADEIFAGTERRKASVTAKLPVSFPKWPKEFSKPTPDPLANGG
jgi:hypothetical protein